ncbi:hypothetical protein CONPUDRAFT_163077 [Coniophora puteana RWD-64-598 SS2]|uniref:Uncharacterized protein n=1 Tax=Coniophora puteana (strain RWD-64-598) TaxID=741705 RepID=A0A5M3MXP3_CONPW|nr:uncharacterized protein CONPUDRAFT_163077 [Coniophora puteana RWD-64-598 SS2]EIW83777.1 hypothetical protein CONPUDRAFT_163077 [Coniophora puteana RWD-64-598 SS2]
MSLQDYVTRKAFRVVPTFPHRFIIRPMPHQTLDYPEQSNCSDILPHISLFPLWHFLFLIFSPLSLAILFSSYTSPLLVRALYSHSVGRFPSLRLDNSHDNTGKHEVQVVKELGDLLLVSSPHVQDEYRSRLSQSLSPVNRT